MDINILRVALAITFFLGGIFIFKDLKKWEEMFLPWVVKFAPITKKRILKFVGVWDIFLSLWLASGIMPAIPAFFMAISLTSALFVMGISYITFRDIGLIVMALFIALNNL